MIRASLAMLFTIAFAPLAASAATCSGADPAITSAVVKTVTTGGSLNTYHLAGTVINLGSQAQPSNTLQFVDIYIDRQKRDSRGIPPLRPGQSYTFGFDWARSADAGNGTTTVQFVIDMRQGSDCDSGNGKYSVTF